MCIFKGEHDKTKNEGSEQVIDVAAVCYHEDFALHHLRHDVAVLTLEKPVTLSEKVSTVCLPRSGQQVATGTKCYITGKSVRSNNDIKPHSNGNMLVQLSSSDIMSWMHGNLVPS